MFSLICPEKKIRCLNFIGPTSSQQIFGFCLTFVFFAIFVCFVLFPFWIGIVLFCCQYFWQAFNQRVPICLKQQKKPYRNIYLFTYFSWLLTLSFESLCSFSFFSVFAFAEFAIRKILFGLALLFIVADTHAHKICYVKLCKYLLRFLFTMTDQAVELKNSLSARSALKTIRECWTLECWIAWCIIKNVIIATNL